MRKGEERQRKRRNNIVIKGVNKWGEIRSKGFHKGKSENRSENRKDIQVTRKRRRVHSGSRSWKQRTEERGNGQEERIKERNLYR